MSSLQEIKPAILGGKTIWPPFTIPSGIITVNTDTILKFAREVPLGMITTKSVGREPYSGYPEPVCSQSCADGLSTAIGLSTMGYKAWIEEIKGIYPLKDKFLLVSIFGETVEDFLEVAPAVAIYADGIELNFCCPHSLKYGEAVAKNGDLTVEITRQVRKIVSKPIVVKLTPNVNDIGQWARRLEEAGADAIAAIGPTAAVTVFDEHTKKPILSFGSGGLSGPAILEKGIESVRAIRSGVKIPIIAGGGIRTKADIIAYHKAGGNIFSIGTSLSGMDTGEIKAYFEDMVAAIEKDKPETEERCSFDALNIKHKPFRVASAEQSGNTAVLRFDRKIDALPGQFVLAWLPGVGEKPFSIAGADPLVMGVKSVGKVSSALVSLKAGDEVMIRGPYGKPFPLHENAILVSGGCGAVPLRYLAEKLVKPQILLGAAVKCELLFEAEFKSLGRTVMATDDGSAGMRGTSVDILKEFLANNDVKNSFFYNCGPERMIKAAIEAERKYVPDNRIIICVERHTCCGVGLCGKCSLDGYRTCVDGPCFSVDMLSTPSALGVYSRKPSGEKIRL